MALPDYAKPPVVEVAVGVQFQPLRNLRAHQAGLFWSQIRDRFPLVEEHPELNISVESFEPPTKKPELRIEFSQQLPAPRTWFLNEEGTELIQLQQNRLVRNWRKLRGPAEYPRYKKMKASFQECFGQLKSFVEAENLGDLTSENCEITYVNHIFLPEGRNPHQEVHRILSVFVDESSTDFLRDKAYEDATLNLRYQIKDRADSGAEPIGRLHITAEPRWQLKDQKPLIAMTLTARSRSGLTKDVEISEFLDLGRKWIVQAFTSITTTEMHTLWGRKS